MFSWGGGLSVPKVSERPGPKSEVASERVGPLPHLGLARSGFQGHFSQRDVSIEWTSSSPGLLW